MSSTTSSRVAARRIPLRGIYPAKRKATDAIGEAPVARKALLVAPVILILLSLVFFRAAIAVFGGRTGQLVGFAFYWLAGGIVLPLLLIGRQRYVDLFRRGSVRWSIPLGAALLLMAAPIALGFLFVFPYFFPADGTAVLIGIAAYAIVNGTLEEVFWRGTFARGFPASTRLGVIYPALGFGLWQLVPWSLFPIWTSVPWIAVLGVAVSVGLIYNWVAWRTRSIRWTVLAHVLTNLSGIGALLIFTPA